MLLTFALACFPQLMPTTTDSADTGADTGEDTSDTTGGTGEDTDCVQKGVETSPTTWELPTGYPELAFKALGDDSSAAPTWGLSDVDGNGRTDIVVTRDDASGTSGLGTTNWQYFSNTGAKFRAAGLPATLPSGYPDLTFESIYDISAAAPTWALSDLDGDGITDLVVTRDDASGVDNLSTSVWLVYPNNGAGFAGTATTWTLPSSYEKHTFSALYDDNLADPAWSLADLDGDGQRDLVITHDDTAGIAGLGSSVWLVYLNTGSGFAATGTQWDLPEGYPDLTFKSIYDADSAAPAWSLLDLDSNGRTDIVVTRDDASGTSGLGTTTWSYYSNTGAKFRAASTPWALPPGYPDNTFETISDANSATPTWSVADLDGDGLTDMVITRNDDAGVPELGTSRWQLFSSDGAGFSQTQTAWPLPNTYPTNTFESLYDIGGGAPSWALTDLDGDGRRDVVVTLDESAGLPALGSTAWLLYPGKCK